MRRSSRSKINTNSDENYHLMEEGRKICKERKQDIKYNSLEIAHMITRLMKLGFLVTAPNETTHCIHNSHDPLYHINDDYQYQSSYNTPPITYSSTIIPNRYMTPTSANTHFIGGKKTRRNKKLRNKKSHKK